MSGRGWRILARAWLTLFALVSGTYALLAYLPFTYEAVIRFPMVSWVPGFVRWHPLLFLATAAVNLLADLPLVRRGARARLGFYLVLGGLALGMAIRPPLAAIRNDASSLVLALEFFLAPIWILALDVLAAWKAAPWRPRDADEPRRLALAALATAVFGLVVFPAVAWLRAPGPAMPWDAVGLVWGWAFWAQLLIALAVAALAMGVASLGRLLPWPGAGVFLVGLTFWLALTGLVDRAVFPALAFHGRLALLAAAAAAGLVAAFLGSAAVAAAPAPEESTLDLALRPLVRLLRGHPLRLLGWYLALAVLAGFILSRAAVFDWNFLFQKSCVTGAEALAFAGTYAAVPARTPRIRWVWALILGPMVVMNLFLAADEGLADRAGSAVPGQKLGPVLDVRIGRDVSARLLRDALTPVRPAQSSIYRILQQNSNIPRDVRTDPVDIQHVDRLAPAPGPKPDIYLLVVDSLRRDYLGAYNPNVHFTPELDRFAGESLVMRNAFTRYGATGLSEPAIWTGALMLHKQYITPFAPMNSLAKLLQADGYRGLVSVDSILDVVVPPGPWLTNLDPGVGTQDLRLGTSLDKVRAFLDRRGPDPRPLFVYTQAQDIHVSVVNREGRTTVEPGDYDGFYAPYASRLHRLDEGFGRFIADLKRRGKFDDSLIIVTADHGDSLGEEGRFGHAYYLYPEVVRIPMFIHLPAAWRQGLSQDPQVLAFLTDLTPTLYYLLGHRPTRVDPMLGKPLFTVTAAERDAYRQDQYLLASSYGAVFGILDGTGRDLYIADGVEFADHLYRLDAGDTFSKRPVTPEAKARFDRMIVEDINKLNQFYRFHPGE